MSWFGWQRIQVWPFARTRASNLPTDTLCYPDIGFSDFKSQLAEVEGRKPLPLWSCLLVPVLVLCHGLCWRQSLGLCLCLRLCLCLCPFVCHCLCCAYTPVNANAACDCQCRCQRLCPSLHLLCRLVPVRLLVPLQMFLVTVPVSEFPGSVRIALQTGPRWT